MFEKLKQKAQKGKEWVIRNKAELAYAGGVAVGVLVTAAVYTYDDKKKREEQKKYFGPELKVMSMAPHGDHRFWRCSTEGIAIGDLSTDMRGFGVPDDAKVVGALMYIKE